MWLDNELQEVVSLFWQRAGYLEPFPRRLEQAVSFALPITLAKLPHLKLSHIEAWLRRRHVSYTFDCESRTVRGCLVAFGGEGIIFTDGSDPDDEQRFTVAHEVSHFMLDYWLPRYQATMRYGTSILSVLDGLRPAAVHERLSVLINGTPIGLHTRLVERKHTCDITWKVEDRADRTALELLAPAEAVLSAADVSQPKFINRFESIQTVLQLRFGLPASITAHYGNSLLCAAGHGPSFRERMGW